MDFTVAIFTKQDIPSSLETYLKTKYQDGWFFYELVPMSDGTLLVVHEKQAE